MTCAGTYLQQCWRKEVNGKRSSPARSCGHHLSPPKAMALIYTHGARVRGHPERLLASCRPEASPAKCFISSADDEYSGSQSYHIQLNRLFPAEGAELKSSQSFLYSDIDRSIHPPPHKQGIPSLHHVPTGFFPLRRGYLLGKLKVSAEEHYTPQFLVYFTLNSSPPVVIQSRNFKFPQQLLSLFWTFVGPLFCWLSPFQ